MNTMYKLLTRKLSTGQFFIRNKALPICSNCLHFIEHKNNYPYDPIPCDTKYGKCKKFGEVNLITGTIEYDVASNCRLNANKCGNFGLEYTKKS
jgi:hypothetical protein